MSLSLNNLHILRSLLMLKYMVYQKWLKWLGCEYMKNPNVSESENQYKLTRIFEQIN